MAGFSLYLLLLVLQLSIGHDLTDINTPNLQDLTLKFNDKIRDLEIKIAQQNTKFSDQNTQIADQNTKLSDQNTQIADFKRQISDQNTQIADFQRQISDQNTQIAELNTKIVEQNVIIAEFKTDIKNQRPEVNQPNTSTNNGTFISGSLFTRWGRRDCPSDVSQLVYSGTTGGSHFKHTGAAAEYVCLPPDPTWSVNKNYTSKDWAYMYGTQYESMPKPIKYYDVPCAVCRSSQYSTVLMIPGRGECYSDWMTAYSGELVSGHHAQNAATQYVCLDGDPQTKGSSKSYNGGKLMYPVRARCGSLPCPPYESNTLMTCVVCLK